MPKYIEQHDTRKKATISEEELERVMILMDDTKKVVIYSKHTGTWSWSDRFNKDSVESQIGIFNTAWEAMKDSVEPYLSDSE
jgi:hypothetical protein